MKKVIALLLLAITMVLSLSSVACSKEKPDDDTPEHVHDYVNGVCECGDEIENYYTPGLEFTLNDNSDGYVVSRYDKKLGTVIIPESYKGLPVVAIGDDVFLNCTKLTKVTIPDTVTEIGDYAFWGCSFLTITIPKNVKKIGQQAFAECKRLSTIYYNATALESVKLGVYEGTGNTSGVFDGSGAYESNEGITVYIGKDVKVIPEKTFYSGSYSTSAKIISVIFEDGCKCEKIGSQAFRDLRHMKSFKFALDGNLKEIGYEALANMGFFVQSFSELIIPKSVEKISKRALTMGKYGTMTPPEIKFMDIDGWFITDNVNNYLSATGGTAVDLTKLPEGSTNVFKLSGGNYMYKSK